MDNFEKDNIDIGSPLILFNEKRNRNLAYEKIHLYLSKKEEYSCFLDNPEFDILSDSTNRLIQYLLKKGYNYLQIGQITGCKDVIDNWIRMDVFRLKSMYTMNYELTKGREAVVKSSLVTKIKNLPPDVKRKIIIALIVLGMLTIGKMQGQYDEDNPFGKSNHNTHDAPYTYSQTYDTGSSRHK